jgi:hypothetical protein
MIGGPHGERDELLRSAELIAQMPELPGWAARPDQSTTLACVCTDAALDKRGCGIVARIASAGIARAVDPASHFWLRPDLKRHGRSRSSARPPRPSPPPRSATPCARPRPLAHRPRRARAKRRGVRDDARP